MAVTDLYLVIRINETPEKLIVEFRDNGVGFPDEILQEEGSKISTGMEIINGVSKKSLRGEVKLMNDKGAVTSISFNKYNPHKL